MLSYYTFADIMKPVDQAIHEEVLRQKKRMMDLPSIELRGLPECESHMFTACGKPQTISLWHHKTSEEEDIFVAQCKRTIFLGYGHMFAEGFVLDSEDSRRDAENELLWDYR